MPGPLPQATRRRTNAATIPTTHLPASGRKGRAPGVPPFVTLGKAGRAWWAWAWRTPQACAWAVGMESVAARRASLEDDLAALASVDGLDFSDLGERADEVRATVARVASLATGRLAILREVRELDDRLGLTPKAMAALRWSIVAEAPAGELVSVPDARWQNAASAS